MDKKKILIIVGILIGVIGIFLLTSYFWNLYQTNLNSPEIITVARGYTENYGTYDSEKSPAEYLMSFKPYLTTKSYEQIAQGFADPNANKETRDYEKAVKYKLQTSVDSVKVASISKEYNNARVSVSVKVETSATDDSGDSYKENRFLNLVKQNGKWFVDLGGTD